MPKLVSDGEERYAEANREELQKVYEQRVAEIKKRYATAAQGNVSERVARYIVVRLEVARAEHEFSKDNLYLSTSGSEFCRHSS